jgi:dsRNA-specific ribonuclease
MGLKKGMTNNPQGRPAGSPNKVTKSMRERVNSFLEEKFDTVQEAFDELDPKDQLQFYIKLLAFGLPTLKAVDHSGLSESRLEALTDEQLNELIHAIADRFEE